MFRSFPRTNCKCQLANVNTCDKYRNAPISILNLKLAGIGFCRITYFAHISKYQVVRRVRATHILLNCGKIIITFIECADLHAASGHANFVGL